MSSKSLTAYSVKIIIWGAKHPETNLPKLEILFNLYIKYIKTITHEESEYKIKTNVNKINLGKYENTSIYLNKGKYGYYYIHFLIINNRNRLQTRFFVWIKYIL